MTKTISLNSVSQVHQFLGLPDPKHPLITVIQANTIDSVENFRDAKIVMNLFQIMLKQGTCGKMSYGRNSYDYKQGTLVFTAPEQVLQFEEGNDYDSNNQEGWLLIFHPDLIRKSDLGAKINSYTFFNYETHEALHLSNEERQTIEESIDKIVKEYSQNLDKHSQHLINSNIELVLDYCLRFYDRQFYTRTNLNLDAISRFERVLKAYYETSKAHDVGLPTVSYCANALNLSKSYLSDLLKKETGKTAQEHLYFFIIEKAKIRLLSSTDSISQIGYALGFEYPQHFSNLFKSKTGFSPREYRNANGDN
ncbi:MAG: helix-turn-helix domain-containing protein [Bacteroidota bacterium]